MKPANRSESPGHVSHASRPPRANSSAASALRTLPSVDELVRHVVAEGNDGTSHDRLVHAARAVLDHARSTIRAGNAAPAVGDLAREVRTLLAEAQRPTLRHVINATGVIINTNLGRAPLSQAALAAMRDVAEGYSNLEYDLADGARGSRHTHVRGLIREVTGAEDALVVNNNASAVLVVLSALAAEREVIVSRGELVEIGGGFRVPDVMRQSGARLIEVGTTNRTRAADYRAAVTPNAALLLAVHPSNFRVVGYTEAPSLAELAEVAHARELPLVYDLGSGCLLPTERWGLQHEPTVRESIVAGADLVCFSGDKLLGGPQAGVIAGRADLLAAMARHPLMRAVRIDKLTLAGLEATLRAFRDGTAEQDIPVWQMISEPLDSIRARAEQWAAAASNCGMNAHATPGESTVGGGSLPGETLPSVCCAIHADANRDIAVLAALLRTGQPPIVGRLLRDTLLLDPRTVAPAEDATLVDALCAAIAAW